MAVIIKVERPGQLLDGGIGAGEQGFGMEKNDFVDDIFGSSMVNLLDCFAEIGRRYSKQGCK